MSNDQEHFDANEPNETESSGAGASYIGAGAGDDGIIASDEKPRVSRGTLVMFGVLLIGAGGFFFMYKKAGPKPAAAAVTKETAEAKKTINSFLSGGDSSIKTMEALIRNTERVVQQFLSYPSMTQVPLSDLRTNPFRLHAEERRTDNTASLSEAAEKKKREEERMAILKAVQGLQLQSIMYSESRKACMINRAIYLEGQTIDNFTVEKISPTTVVVKNGPYRFELSMQR